METTTTPQTMTAEELLQLPDDGFKYELIDGELKKMPPPGFEHGIIAYNIGEPLKAYIKANNLGVVVGEVGFELDPHTVLAPDVAYVSKNRYEQVGRTKSYFKGPPDMAVEVISPNDIYTDVEEKVRKWLRYGTRMVVVINPRHNTVAVYYGDGRVTFLTEQDELSGGDVVPGWTMPVRELFV